MHSNDLTRFNLCEKKKKFDIRIRGIYDKRLVGMTEKSKAPPYDDVLHTLCKKGFAQNMKGMLN